MPRWEICDIREVVIEKLREGWKRYAWSAELYVPQGGTTSILRTEGWDVKWEGPNWKPVDAEVRVNQRAGLIATLGLQGWEPVALPMPSGQDRGLGSYVTTSVVWYFKRQRPDA